MMKRCTRFVPLLILLPMLGCASRQRAAAPVVLTADAGEVQSAGYQTYWLAQLPMRPGDGVDRIFLRDDSLYVTSNKGDLFALRADQGLLRWRREVAQPGFTVFAPTHARTDDGLGPVIVSTTSRLYLLDRYTGDIEQSAMMPFAPGTSFIGENKDLFAGSSDGNLYSLRWPNTFGPDPRERWRLACGSVVKGMPVLRDGVLYFATIQGKVASCSALDKAYGWIAKLGPITSELAVDDMNVYAASANGSVYALHRGTGEIVWRTRFQHMLMEGPVLKNATLYQYCPGEGVSALDSADGKVRWTSPVAVSFLSSQGGETVLLCASGTVTVVDDKTGESIRTFSAGSVHASAVNTQDDAVFLAYSDGRIACHRPKGIPYLRKQEVEAARAVLNRAPRQITTAADTEPGARSKRQADPLRSDRDTVSP